MQTPPHISVIYTYMHTHAYIHAYINAYIHIQYSCFWLGLVPPPPRSSAGVKILLI